MEILDKYNDLKQQIYDYFKFQEDWPVFPIEDSREFYWMIVDNHVRFAETEDKLKDIDAGLFYENEVMTHRHYPKNIYEGAEFTLIIVDTHTDGNKFLQIFDNAKRI